MLFLSVSSSLMLIYLLLALCCNTYTAPTHHLTIGVQGNTPTLIVTSSEIGITPETMGSVRKTVKHDHTEKKSLKTKLNKNHSAFDKKEKLHYLAKPSNKHSNSEEKSLELMKSVKSFSKPTSSEEKSYEVRRTIEKQERIFEKLKQTKNNTELLKDQETTTQKLQEFKTTTSVDHITTTITTKTENVDIYTSKLQLTTLTPQQINDDIQSTSFTHEEASTLMPQDNTDKTSLTPLKFEDVDDLKNSPDLLTTTTLNPKDFDDITTTTPATTITSTINYEDATNTATISKDLTKTQTETEANIAAQTEQTTQIVQDTTVIKTEYENDSNTQTPVATTENENLLLTTIETKGFNTPTTTPTTTAMADAGTSNSSSPPIIVTLITDNAEATTTTEMLSMPLTMTTTAENVVDDDNNNNDNKKEQQQQQQFTTIDYSETATYMATTEKFKEEEREKDKETENPIEAESQGNINSGITIKPKEEYTLATTTIKEQSENDDLKSTENPVQAISVATNQANENVQNKIVIETITETEDIETTTSNSTPLTITEQAFNTFETQRKDIETTTEATMTTSESTTTTTTEAVLKLIDLEKHVLKTIDELKQPSSLLMAGQHDNGHDGLKNIKKKQLIDKHYVEALLHNKQDVHTKDSAENERYLPLTTSAPTSSPSNAATFTTTTSTTNKPLLMPIKHGYLGPIVMEEKTFHVIHHADNAMSLRNKHLAEIEAQLRKGHFVELKAKTEISADDSLRNDKSLSMEMLSDQPALETTFEIKEKAVDLKKSKENAKVNLYKLPGNAAFSQEIIKKKEPTFDTLEYVTSTTKNPTEGNTNKIKSLQKPKLFSENLNLESISPITKDKPDKDTPQEIENPAKSGSVLSTTVFQVIDSVATKTPMVQANTLFTSEDKEKEQTESKISDIQIEVYDSTIDSIVASTNFKDGGESVGKQNDESSLGKTTKPPIAAMQQERFTQYVIDRTETSTQEPINYSTIQLANGKPEPAAIEIHINVSESFGNESEDLEFSYPQSEYNNNNNNERLGEESYDDSKVNDNIKLKIPSNTNNNGKDLRNDEILVVEIIDTDNITDTALKLKSKNNDELFISDVKELYTTPPPPPPPPPYQTNFDRDSDTIFYISNTEVKVGESLPTNNKNANEERKLKLESQFFPANYMASTHPNVNSREEINPPHHLYEEDIILSSSRNQADSLKIYRNRNEPSPPLDVTYVGESIIEVEQSPDSVITTTDAPDQQHNAGAAATPQADVIIQPAILPEISIGVPVIGELPPQIELKEIDFMPNEAQLHRSGIYDDNDNSNGNNNNNIMFNNDIDENTISGGGGNNHDADVVNSNGNNNQRVDESSIQYGGDLIDESADGGFDGVEGSYPFGNPAAIGKSSSSHYSSGFLAKLRKQQQQQQQPNHVADYAHLYVNYGVNNMRKDELSADVKDSGELLLIGGGGGSGSVNSNEQNITSFKDFLNKVSMSNSSIPFLSANTSQNERMSNATAFSVMEDANDLEDKNTEDIINLISLAIGLFIVILPVVVTCSMFWALRYLYKKYHSNITDSGGYTDQTETKTPLNDDGVEKGEFVHEPSSSPTNSNKDAIEKYPDTSNKPSTTETNIKFSTEKPTSDLETTTSKTNTTTTNTTTTTSTTTNSKTNDTLKLSLALSSPITQPPPPASASSSSSAVTCTTATTTTNEQILTVHGDVDNENGAGDDDDVEMPGPNGSITKMTLENNLLIVETEERNDISRVARETKMDYNKDGVFVVEVARGIDSKTIPESPVTDGSEKMLSMFDTKHNNGGLGYKVTNEKNCVNNEKVQIHSPPPENGEEGPRSLHQIEELEEPTNSPQLNDNNDETIVGLAYKANTGLSQSDLSTTSSSDSNKGYCYGNQELYVVEQSGYSPVTPNGNVVLKCDVKDIKDDDRNPGNDHYLKHSPDKREESNNKEDIVETTRKPEEGGSRTSSGESPAQKQNDKAQENEDSVLVTENTQNLQINESNNSEVSEEKSEVEKVTEKQLESIDNLENPIENPTKSLNVPIPVEIEVHITPAQMEQSNASETLSPVETTITADSPILKATESVTEPLVLETIPVELEDTLAVETLLPIEETIPLNETTSSLLVEEDETGNSISDDMAILAVPDKFSDKETSQEDVSSIRAMEKDTITLENMYDPIETEAVNETDAEVPIDPVETEVAKETNAEVSTDPMETEVVTETEAVKEMDTEVPIDPMETEVVKETEAVKATDPGVSIDLKETEVVKETEAEVPILEKKLEEKTAEELMEVRLEVEKHINDISECQKTESEKIQDLCITENGLGSNEESPLHINGDKEETNETELPPEDVNTSNINENELHKTDSENGLTQSDVESLTNGSNDLVKSPQIHNGHAEIEPISISINDMENGYDSIMSLPEPPPTTDEQLNSDLSDQQLDSLPPPPPPEIFNLKDLPPPLTNGNADSPQSEESNNFYNTLPPPPPTTLEVTASAETTTTTATTNGKVHASPLTPPASPPAHFTNNLHAGLCSQPIAVDVNGS